MNRNGSVYQALTVVTGQVALADGNETPERLLGGHVHDEHRGDGGVALEIAVHGIEDGVRFQDSEQLRLPEEAISNSKINTCSLSVSLSQSSS